MKLASFFVCILTLMITTLSADTKGNYKMSKYFGFKCYDFVHEGRKASVVVPENPRTDKAWIVRPAFFRAFPNGDIELVKRGFYLTYFDVTHDYGRVQARKLMDSFYTFMTSSHWALNKKVTVEGLSRGGAFALMWANDDPSKLACVYADNPVCDFREWPVKKEPKLIPDFRAKWNLKEGEELTFNKNPFDNLETLAKSKVPVLMIYGDKDNTVPFEKHGKIYQQRFLDAGGNIQLICRKGAKHHPHGLKDPKPIIDFIEKAYSK